MMEKRTPEELTPIDGMDHACHWRRLVVKLQVERDEARVVIEKAHDLVARPTDDPRHDTASCLIDGILCLKEALTEARAVLGAVNVALAGQGGVTDVELSFPPVRAVVNALAALNRSNTLLTFAEQERDAARAYQAEAVARAEAAEAERDWLAKENETLKRHARVDDVAFDSMNHAAVDAETERDRLRADHEAVYALGCTPVEQSRQIPLPQWVKTRFVHVERFNEVQDERDRLREALLSLRNEAQG